MTLSFWPFRVGLLQQGKEKKRKGKVATRGREEGIGRRIWNEKKNDKICCNRKERERRGPRVGEISLEDLDLELRIVGSGRMIEGPSIERKMLSIKEGFVDSDVWGGGAL